MPYLRIMEGVCLEPGCGGSFPNLRMLRAHLVDTHGKPMEMKQLHFTNFREFAQWKSRTELEDLVKFRNAEIRYTDDRMSSVHYYFCCQPKLAKLGSSQTAYCTAMITAHLSKTIMVQYFKTHYNHFCMRTNSPANLDSLELPAVQRSSSEMVQPVYFKGCTVTPVTNDVETDDSNMSLVDSAEDEAGRFDLEEEDSATYRRNRLKRYERSHRFMSTHRAQRHDTALKALRDPNVVVKTLVEDKHWLVKYGNHTFKVSVIPDRSDPCRNMCQRCSACKHMYACTCAEYRSQGRDIACVHVHMVSIKYEGEREHDEHQQALEMNDCEVTVVTPDKEWLIAADDGEFLIVCVEKEMDYDTYMEYGKEGDVDHEECLDRNACDMCHACKDLYICNCDTNFNSHWACKHIHYLCIHGPF